MDSKLQNKLFEKYPSVFKQKDLSMQNTCMCWGCECGNGWYSLLDELCEKISKICPTTEFVQVKEKWGLLRIYVNNASDEVCKLLDEVGKESAKVCEECGSRDNVSRNDKGWIQTLCDKCRKELK